MLLRLSQALQVLALILVGIIAMVLTAATLASALGELPWLTFTARFGEVSYIYAGEATQIGVTLLFGLLFFFIPGQARLLTLERSHRDFRISMDDVARAYHLAHSADRAGVFTLSSEFDQVRERLTFLRDHPDMIELESDVLTVAAQMGQQARRLAEVYSVDKVKLAREFLTQRQAEAEAQQARILEAQHACREIRKWSQQVELEESIVASQLARLDEQLQAALPALGYVMEGLDTVPVAPPAGTGTQSERAANVVSISKPAASDPVAAPRPAAE